MHEMSIVEALLGAVCSELRAHPGARVRAVHVRIGQLRLIESSMLEFCFTAAVRDTFLGSTRLEIEQVKAAARCDVCSLEFPVEENWFECPRCSSPNARLLKGDELLLTSLDIQEGPSPNAKAPNSHVSSHA
jgi:hydrogenase nickel incorporation protein HypA/HybF